MSAQALEIGRTSGLIEPLEARCLLSADLTGEFIGTVPASLSPAGKNHLAVQIVNSGDTPFRGRISVTLYASADATLDSSDTPLATVGGSIRLQTGQGHRLSFEFSMPDTLPTGSDYLLAKIDGGAAGVGSVFASANPVAVTQPYLDLVTEFVYLPGQSIQTNGIVSNHPWAAVQVVNIGNTVVRGTVDLGLYMSPTAVLDGSAALAALWKPTAIALGPGRSRLFAAQIVLPYGTMPGSYTLFGVATPTRGITTRQPADLVAAAAAPLDVVSSVATATLLDNYHRHHHRCEFYDGSDYIADTSAAYGYDDVVVEGESIPPDFTPNSSGPTSAPASQPSSQPASQPDGEIWDNGLLNATAVAVQMAATGNGNADNPGNSFGTDSGGDSGASGGSGDDGDDGGDDGGGDDGGGDDGDDVFRRT